jgi:asparagine synthase (glutamine-hydrolysing)
MCGFVGSIQEGGPPPDELTRMAESIRHRGPDDAGVWIDPAAGIGLAHRRLSIVDLSPAGHQPMHSESGRLVIAFNGEIYNHLAVRAELEAAGAAPAWRGHSDTETLLAAFERWGVRDTLRRTVGMFAFALWNTSERILYLGRDRLGEKPLYFGWQGGAFVFASELKALRRHRAFRGELDRDALAAYFRHNYIPAPLSIYRGIRKVEPGTFVALQWRPGDGPVEPRAHAYWRLADAIRTGAERPFEGDDHEATDELERVLRDSIGLQQVADVPLGAFLSGGIDSSTVVALMRDVTGRPPRTFTIGYHEPGYNEAEHAAAVARHLGSDHTEVYVSERDFLDVVPRLPDIYDEPFSDSSQVPTVLLCALARRSVTVALSGDGGDELLGGYGRYFKARAVRRSLQRVPRMLRRIAGKGLSTVPTQAWSTAYRALEPLMPVGLRVARPSDKAERLARLMRTEGADSIYRQIVSHWHDPEALLVEGVEPPTVLTDPSRWPAPIEGFEAWMMGVDTLSYLPDDILVKVDRAAMSASLETRVPMLDHRVVEFCWQLPLSMRMRGDQGKWLLRRVLDRHVPRTLTDRPKRGFSAPIESWLRGPLRSWAGELLDETRLRSEGVLRSEPVAALWREHLAGRGNGHYLLWDVLMFQAWLERQRTDA